MTLPSLLSDRLTRRASIISIVVLTLAVPLLVWAAATIPAGCSTPGDCEDLTPTFQTLSVKELLRGSGAFVIEAGAAIDGTTFVVDEVNNRVGIGTAAPLTKLVINDNISGTNGYLATLGNSTGNAYWVIGQHADYSLGFGWTYNATPANSMADFWTSSFFTPIRFNGSKIILQDLSGGNVGIGTATPKAKLDVLGTVSGSRLSISNNANISGALLVQGNVGIGTTSPGAKLDVTGGNININRDSADAEIVTAAYSDSQVWGVFRSVRARGTQAAPTAAQDGDLIGAFVSRPYTGTSFLTSAQIDTAVDGSLGASRLPALINFRTSDGSAGTVTRMVIKGSGNVGIGTATPTEELEVVGTVSGSVLQATDLMHLVPRSAAPGSPSAGDMYYDSTSNELCFYDGTSWTGLKAAGACS